MPYEVPLNMSEPKLVVTVEQAKAMPVPFATVPVIVTLTAPVAEMLAYNPRETPMERDAVAHEVPLTVIEPELVVTVDPFAKMP